MARKGMKIQVEKIHFDKKWHEYTIKLNKGDGKFYIEIDKGTPLYDIAKNAKIDWASWYEYKEVIRAVKKAVDDYIESKIEKVAVKTKVILFTMEMDFHEKIYDEDGDWRVGEHRRDSFGHTGTPCPKLKFDYRMAMKVEVDGEVLRYHRLDNETYTVHVDSDENEVDWSQETEELFESLYKGLVGLCKKLNSFFGEENNMVLENMSKLNGSLLEFKDE